METVDRAAGAVWQKCRIDRRTLANASQVWLRVADAYQRHACALQASDPKRASQVPFEATLVCIPCMRT